MIIGRELKYIFIGCPKAGCHSMNQLLTREFGGRHLALIMAGKTSGVANPFHVNVIPPEYRGFFTFASVRDPFSRAVSIWHHVTTVEPAKTIHRSYTNGDMSFGAFTRWLAAWNAANRRCHNWEVFVPQGEWLWGIRLDAVVHLEKIREEFNELPLFHRRPCRPVYTMPHLNRRGNKLKKPWQSYYDDRSRRDVWSWASEDFIRFGYECPEKWRTA